MIGADLIISRDVGNFREDQRLTGLLHSHIQAAGFSSALLISIDKLG